MKKTRIIYWILTGLFAFFMFGSAVPDALVMPVAVNGFKEMGYPAYLVPFLGVAKILGVIAILIPGYPRIKEWAYAGLAFDLIGATYSVICINKSVQNWAPMLVILAVGAGSYIYYHKKLKGALKGAYVDVTLPTELATA
jgi:uncharacterized membrane protein YphA (DoxX/SURF4 family)